MMTTPSAAVATIAAMITPALLILASASLVASALVRMARVVDRARLLATIAFEADPANRSTTKPQIRSWLVAHALRARFVELSIAAFYGAIVVFVATCLSIAADRASGGALAWLPIGLSVFGMTLLLAGGALLVVESRASADQIAQEISHALSHLENMQ